MGLVWRSIRLTPLPSHTHRPSLYRNCITPQASRVPSTSSSTLTTVTSSLANPVSLWTQRAPGRDAPTGSSTASLAAPYEMCEVDVRGMVGAPLDALADATPSLARVPPLLLTPTAAAPTPRTATWTGSAPSTPPAPCTARASRRRCCSSTESSPLSWRTSSLLSTHTCARETLMLDLFHALPAVFASLP